MATATQRGQIIALVDVIFDAAPGGYLNDLVAAFDGGASLLSLANAMANTSIAKSSQFYPAFLTNTEFATKLVANLTEATPLAPAAQTLATDYITGLLNSGQSRGQVFLTVSSFLTNPATLGDAQFGQLAQQFQNEVSVATYYTVDKGGSSLDVGTLQNVLNGITADAASVAAAKAAVDNGSYIDGKVFNLTTGQDTFTGTGGVDTFNAFIGVDGNGNDVSTLNSQDNLDGGGGVDTLNLVANRDTLVAPTMKNVEVVSIRVTGSDTTASLDFSNVHGVQTVEFHDQLIGTWASVDIRNIQEVIPNVKLTNLAHGSTASFSLEYAPGVATGSNDTVNIVATNVGSDSNGDGWADDYTLSFTATTWSGSAAYEHFNIQSLGTQAGGNGITLWDATHAQDVTITGTANLWLDISDAESLTKVDASALKAGLNVQIDAKSNDVTVTTANGSYDDVVNITNSVAGKGHHTINTFGGNDTITVDDGGSTINAGDGNDKVTVSSGKDTVDLGAGDDTLTVGANLAAGDSFSGGAGRDTIVVDSATGKAGIPLDAVTKAPLATVQGFEILGISNTLADDIDLQATAWKQADSTIFDSITLKAGFTTHTVSNLGANSTVTTQAASAGQVLTANLKDATGTSDVLNIVTKATGSLDFGQIKTSAVETLNVTLDDTSSTKSTSTATLAVDDVGAKTINIAGDYKVGALTFTDLALVTVVNAGTFTGGVNSDFSAAGKAITFTGGAGVDTVTFAKGGDTITTGAGNDAVTIAATGKGETIDLGAGNDTLSLANSTNQKITLGAGTDTVTVTGAAVPANGQSYSTINDFAKGDKIDLSSLGAFATVGTKLALASTAVFQDYLDAGTAGGVAGTAAWFQFGGDTYLVVDESAAATFQNNADFVIKLAGLVDLGSATTTVVGGVITGG